VNLFERGEIGPDLFRKTCEFGLRGSTEQTPRPSRQSSKAPPSSNGKSDGVVPLTTQAFPSGISVKASAKCLFDLPIGFPIAGSGKMAFLKQKISL
jgi:hypothetical protein